MTLVPHTDVSDEKWVRDVISQRELHKNFTTPRTLVYGCSKRIDSSPRFSISRRDFTNYVISMRSSLHGRTVILGLIASEIARVFHTKEFYHAQVTSEILIEHIYFRIDRLLYYQRNATWDYVLILRFYKDKEESLHQLATNGISCIEDFLFSLKF